ncbi:unnamed protein product [Prunus armeniaca]|nr:unnamed protein product [Prunus armeniaca]
MVLEKTINCYLVVQLHCQISSFCFIDMMNNSIQIVKVPIAVSVTLFEAKFLCKGTRLWDSSWYGG